MRSSSRFCGKIRTGLSSHKTMNTFLSAETVQNREKITFYTVVSRKLIASVGWGAHWTQRDCLCRSSWKISIFSSTRFYRNWAALRLARCLANTRQWSPNTRRLVSSPDLVLKHQESHHSRISILKYFSCDTHIHLNREQILRLSFLTRAPNDEAHKNGYLKWIKMLENDMER